MRNTITVTIDANAHDKITISSENINILNMDDKYSVDKSLYTDILTMLYATKKLVAKANERGIIKDDKIIDSNLESVIELIKN
tara:strand:- start:210 stop:458 length:249 start_codon:yes stop_codon:yes gene_type:complete